MWVNFSHWGELRNLHKEELPPLTYFIAFHRKRKMWKEKRNHIWSSDSESLFPKWEFMTSVFLKWKTSHSPHKNIHNYARSFLVHVSSPIRRLLRCCKYVLGNIVFESEMCLPTTRREKVEEEGAEKTVYSCDRQIASSRMSFLL